ncbi:hypothetical protein [Pelosinus sp. IPA-1]|uniref:hypothetical protein n=1 Tax=Pelosinus sp. IPA-1 TaxID=3029569 RepID=UPI002436195A|nr:hypothetical protein [Pelosinus sp. IPA-1]GMA98232.1 hypothetical protein PIPA1_10320 [Pelosinus sp. IPA-1]
MILARNWFDDLILAGFEKNDCDSVIIALKRWESITELERGKTADNPIPLPTIRTYMVGCIQPLEDIVKKYPI